MSPWVNPKVGAEGLGPGYVFSYKPNPATLAAERWAPGVARDEMRRALDVTRGFPVELVMKDLHSCRGEPLRVWEWTRLASELAQEYAA